ncbi:MAG: hypothetical protein JSV42_02290 [Chloroflexota bacterium]|nr:MAG: hypothetical protein JSV42_02290 [Chloroflexota bacterium]
MLLILLIAILAITALVMLILRLVRPDFGYHWLIATGGALVSWIVVFLVKFQLPITLQMVNWGPQTTFPNSFILVADQVSWPFALGLCTLALGTLLTDVIRAYDLEWSNWASSLAITAIGLLSVFSGNLLSFILAWTAFDLVNLIIYLAQLQIGRSRRRAAWLFFARLIGSTFLLIGGVIAVDDNASFLLERVSPGAILFIVLASGIRISSVLIESSIIENQVNRRSFGTVACLGSATIVFVFLARIASAVGNVQSASAGTLTIFGLIGLVSLVAALGWLLAKDELDGRHAFILGVGSIVIATSIRAEAGASISWGFSGLLSGGLIFLSSVRSRFSRWISLFGLLGISILPFTSSWGTHALFAAPLNIFHLLYFFAFILLLLGYAGHASQEKLASPGIEPWIRLVYPVGLILILLVQLTFVWFYLPELGEVAIAGWIVGPLISFIVLLGYFWQNRGERISRFQTGRLNASLSLEWLYPIIQSLFRYLARLLHFFSRVLEGEGGFLWVMLWIILILAILIISFAS